MSHRNARPTVRVRLEMVKQVESGWPQAEVAKKTSESNFMSPQKYLVIVRYDAGENRILNAKFALADPKVSPLKSLGSSVTAQTPKQNLVALHRRSTSRRVIIGTYLGLRPVPLDPGGGS